MEFLISGVCDTRIVNWEKIGLDPVHTLLGCTVFTHPYIYVCLYICLFIYTHTHSHSCFLHSRKHHHQIEKTMTNWKNVYHLHYGCCISLSNIYPLKLRKKRTGNYIEKWTKENEQWDELRFATSWCWSWNSNTLATWCEELTHLKRRPLPWATVKQAVCEPTQDTETGARGEGPLADISYPFHTSHLPC